MSRPFPTQDSAATKRPKPDVPAFVCELCGVAANSLASLENHLASKRHKNAVLALRNDAPAAPVPIGIACNNRPSSFTALTEVIAALFETFPIETAQSMYICRSLPSPQSEQFVTIGSRLDNIDRYSAAVLQLPRSIPFHASRARRLLATNTLPASPQQPTLTDSDRRALQVDCLLRELSGQSSQARAGRLILNAAFVNLLDQVNCAASLLNDLPALDTFRMYFYHTAAVPTSRYHPLFHRASAAPDPPFSWTRPRSNSAPGLGAVHACGCSTTDYQVAADTLVDFVHEDAHFLEHLSRLSLDNNSDESADNYCDIDISDELADCDADDDYDDG
jgi:Zinc-finger of C2H2 type